MTAEIAVLNKHGVALASDSAVTIQHRNGDKVYNSVNKLFALSKYAPVGVMIYGEADFMEVPWEPVLKMYRAQLGRRRFGRIVEYAANLLGYVERHPAFTQDGTREDRTFVRRVTDYFELIRWAVNEQVRTAKNSGAAVNEAAIIDDKLDAAVMWLKRCGRLDGVPTTIASSRRKLVSDLRDEIFKGLTLSTGHKKKLTSIAGKLFTSKYMPDNSGLVIAGFGEDEMYPALSSMHLCGVYKGNIRWVPKDAFNVTADQRAAVLPFAQSDMVETFLKGINSRLARALEKYLAETMTKIPVDLMAKQLGLSSEQHEQLKIMVAALGQITCDVFGKESAALQQREHVAPVTAALAHAPKEELAELAESLVHLTSLKRRVALETETVGGPIDVAIISKGDGFIWIKRKHYFKPELNPYFLATYYQRDDYYAAGNDEPKVEHQEDKP